MVKVTSIAAVIISTLDTSRSVAATSPSVFFCTSSANWLSAAMWLKENTSTGRISNRPCHTE